MESLKTNATMYWGDNESLYHGCVVASHLKQSKVLDALSYGDLS
jgi:hypothetical protein